MQSMMYPHFVFTHTRILQIEFSVIDLVCCFSLDMASDDDSGDESFRSRTFGINENDTARKLIPDYLHSSR